MKQTALRLSGRTENTRLDHFVGGGLGGVTAWCSIYPLDVVKSRLQQDNRTYAGFWDCAGRMLRTEGPGVFFKGLAVCLGRGFLVNGVTFVAYEETMSLVSALNGRSRPRGSTPTKQKTQAAPGAAVSRED